jgi:hypothetical protein
MTDAELLVTIQRTAGVRLIEVDRSGSARVRYESGIGAVDTGVRPALEKTIAEYSHLTQLAQRSG